VHVREHHDGLNLGVFCCQHGFSEPCFLHCRFDRLHLDSVAGVSHVVQETEHQQLCAHGARDASVGRAQQRRRTLVPDVTLYVAALPAVDEPALLYQCMSQTSSHSVQVQKRAQNLTWTMFSIVESM
jgi:hypothetical protein